MIRSPHRSVATFAALSFALISLGSSSASAQPHQRWAQSGDNELRVRFGVFTPDGDGEYFADKFVDFTGQAADFEDGAFAVEYTREPDGFLGLLAAGRGGRRLRQRDEPNHLAVELERRASELERRVAERTAVGVVA